MSRRPLRPSGRWRNVTVTRQVLGLFRGVPGARAFRRYLATEAIRPAAGAAAFRAALALIADIDAHTVAAA